MNEIIEGTKAILITGASGFIGNFLVEEAIKRGYIVYAVVRDSSDVTALKKLKATIISIDFDDINDTYYKLLNLPRFNYVIHNAGITKTIIKGDFVTINYGITKRLILALVQQQKVPDKIFYMSSLAAFGPGDINSSNPIDSYTQPNPVTQYGKSKLAAERYIIEESGIPYIIFRPTAVYGPGDKDFLKTIKLIKKGVDFQIGLKPQYLTFVYVKDLARLVFDAIESPFSNKAYFVSDGNLYTNKDLGKYVSVHLKKKISHIPIPLFVAKIITWVIGLLSKFSKKPNILTTEKIKELSANNWNCDIVPLVDDFDYEAEYDLDKGMEETINWYKKEGWLK